MPQYSDGTQVSKTEWDRLLEAIPASYVIWKDGSTYRGECNVKDGTDYSDSDFTTVIEDILSVLTNGGSIFLRRGTYSGHDIDVTTDYITIRGEGDGTILELDADDVMFDVKGADVWPDTLRRFYLRDLKIVGYGSSHTQPAVSLDYTDWCYVNNVHFEECYDGIYDNHGSNTFFIGNHFYAWYRYAINHYNSESVILGNSMDISKAADEGDVSKKGLACVGGENVIANNIFEGVYGAAGDGVVISGTKNVIVGNQFRQCDRWGLVLSDTCQWSTVTGNNFAVNGDDGLQVSGDNNTITGNEFYDNTDYGLYVAVGAENNIVLSNGYHGNTTGCINDLGTNTKVPTVPVLNILDDTDGNATLSNLGDHLTISCADGQDVTTRFNFVIPNCFQELVTAKLYVASPCSGGTVLRWNATTDFGAADEAYNVHSDSISATDTTLAADKFESLDLSAAFTGIAAGDRVGVAFEREGAHANDTLGAVLHVHSFLLRYV
jgi:hypothetical protein